jgi:hypothetical protein
VLLDTRDIDKDDLFENDYNEDDYDPLDPDGDSSAMEVDSQTGDPQHDEDGDYFMLDAEPGNFLGGHFQDFSNQSIEDHELEVPYLSTNPADEPIVVEQMPSKDIISGHVMMNQVSNCTSRFGRVLSGRAREKFFVQSFVSTTPNKAVPLIYPEGAMFPSIFYASSKYCPHSVLGSLPLFAVGPDCTRFGYADPIITTRSRIWSTRLSSTCKFYRRHRFDIHANIQLSTGDSRQIIDRGFRVDSNSKSGLSVDNDGGSCLTESIDLAELVVFLSVGKSPHN